MSNPESFVEEVTEEVRRDKLYRVYRKYGWIALIAVILIVGGASWNEYRKSKARAAAETYGDALFDALSKDDMSARRAALSAVVTPPGAEPLTALLTAGTEFENPETAVAALEELASAPETPDLYRQFAQLRMVIAGAEVIPASDRLQALSQLSQDGAPFRGLAEEQKALIQIEMGEKEAAAETLTALVQSADATQPLRDRALQLLVAIGGESALR